MRRTLLGSWLVVAVLAIFSSHAGAVALPGDPAPNFTKNELDYPVFGSTTPRSLSDYLGKVVFLFVFGYS